MTLIEEISNKSPFIGNHDDFMEQFIGMYTMSQDFMLKSRHIQVPEVIKEYTDYIRSNIKGEMPYMRRVMTMPATMTNEYWEKIKKTPQLMGPRVIRTSDQMEEVTKHERGNYFVMWNISSEELLFIWAPVYELEEAFAKHWHLFRYCFETNVIDMENNKVWKLWAIGETSNNRGKRDRDGRITVKINDYSGSFRDIIERSVGVSFKFVASWSTEEREAWQNKEHIKVSDHYQKVVRVLSEKFNTPFVYVKSELKLPSRVNYEDLEVNCPLIPRNKSDFNPNMCYQYNKFAFHFSELNSIYDNFRKDLTIEEFLKSETADEDLTKEGADLERFGELLTELSRV